MSDDRTMRAAQNICDALLRADMAAKMKALEDAELCVCAGYKPDNGYSRSVAFLVRGMSAGEALEAIRQARIVIKRAKRERLWRQASTAILPVNDNYHEAGFATLSGYPMNEGDPV